VRALRGAAQGSYMSVYLTLVRTELDELLEWPFSKRVSVTLLDQSDDPSARRHVTHVVVVAMTSS